MFLLGYSVDFLNGTGKSTLLDLLTGRRAVGRCEGEIYFEGKNIVEQQVGAASTLRAWVCQAN